MARQKMTSKQEEDLFLDIWYKLLPETFDDLYDHYAKHPKYPRIPEGADMINDCVDMFPKLYRKIMDLLEVEANKLGYTTGGAGERGVTT